MRRMREIIILFVHLVVTVVRLARPGGLRSVVAESILVKHQLQMLNRGRKRSPNLLATDRIVVGFCALFMRRARLLRSAIILKPSTLLHLQNVLKKRKYRMLFSAKLRRRPGPKGPKKELIAAVVEMKRRNPNWGCPRIAQQITLAFGVDIDKDMFRRILSVHYPGPTLWFESILAHLSRPYKGQLVELRFVPMRVCNTENTLGSRGDGPIYTAVDRVWRPRRHCRRSSACRMFSRAIGRQSLPKYLSSDNDPLYRFHQWQANLRVLEVTEIKTVPYVPLSHPFVERLIGTIRREYLDRMLFWTTVDLEEKLLDFQRYYNAHRAHAGLRGRPPEPGIGKSPIDLGLYRWQKHCRGLYQLPVAA